MPGVGDRFLDVDGGNARKRTAPYLIRVADGGFGVIGIENKLAGGARFVRFDGKPVHRWRVEQYLSCENQFAVAQKPLAGAADLWELELRAKDALGDRRQGLFIDNRSACRARRFERMADGVAIRFDGVRLPDGEADVVACVRLTEWGHLNSVKMIFDTDMYTDFDDAGALACLHALADAGECEILATIANTRESKSVAMCEIINAYYGRPDIPVGCVKGIGMGNDRRGEHERRYGATVKKYAKWVKHPNFDDAPDAAEVYRQVLSAQPDKSVVICSVGFLSNMCKLMETDRDLVAQKVKLWVAMACFYPKGKEYNSMMDWESSKIALENWPTAVVFSDFQYGLDCFAGRMIAESNVQDSPVADVFRGNIPSREEIAKDTARHLRSCNGRGGRSAWDEPAVLAAVRGVDSYFNVHRGMFRMISSEGENEWVPDEENGPHLRLTEKLNKLGVGKIIDELICRKPLKK